MNRANKDTFWVHTYFREYGSKGFLSLGQKHLRLFLEFEFSEALEFDSYEIEINHGYLFYETAKS